MSRGSKSTRHNKLTKQFHAENQRAIKQKTCWDNTVELNLFHKAISRSYWKKENTANVQMMNSGRFCGKVLLKTKDDIWRIF